MFSLRPSGSDGTTPQQATADAQPQQDTSVRQDTRRSETSARSDGSDGSDGHEDAGSDPTSLYDGPLAMPTLLEVHARRTDAGDAGDSGRYFEIVWQNNQPDCGLIEGEHENALLSYALRFSVSRSTTRTTYPGTYPTSVQYTYRVRCKKGVSCSAYSNELSDMFQ
jgi:hypothetical protein